MEAALETREEMLEAAFPPEAEELDMAMEVEDPAAELEARLLFISIPNNRAVMGHRGTYEEVEEEPPLVVPAPPVGTVEAVAFKHESELPA